MYPPYLPAWDVVQPIINYPVTGQSSADRKESFEAFVIEKELNWKEVFGIILDIS